MKKQVLFLTVLLSLFGDYAEAMEKEKKSLAEIKIDPSIQTLQDKADAEALKAFLYDQFGEEVFEATPCQCAKGIFCAPCQLCLEGEPGKGVGCACALTCGLGLCCVETAWTAIKNCASFLAFQCCKVPNDSLDKKADKKQ